MPRQRAITILCIVLAGGTSLLAQSSTTVGASPLDSLFLLQHTKTLRVSSWDRSGGNNDFVSVAPGQTRTLAEISGTGVIRRIFFGVSAPDRMKLRKLVLRMYWDGHREPCVEVPLGDFFGSGLGTLRRFHSATVDVNPGFSILDFDGMVTYLPMPFGRGARVTVENDGGLRDVFLWYHIDYEQYRDGALPANAGRLHSQWRHVDSTPVRAGTPKNSPFGNISAANTTGDDNVVMLDATGQGSYVGQFLTVDNRAGGWYGQGDDMIFIDGVKWPPTYPGTGHEEIFNAGAVPDEEYAGQYTGIYLIENYKAPWGGKNQMYRFFINDPVRFQTSIKVTIEHGHDNNFENSYTSTVFWYQQEPHKPFPRLPAAPQRVPIWPEGVAQALETETYLRPHVATPPMFTGIVTLSNTDAADWNRLETSRNKAFRALRYDDFIRDVNATEALLKTYPAFKPLQP